MSAAATRNLVLSGGVGHDFAATSHALAELLAPLGFATEVVEDVDAGLTRLAAERPPLLTVNLLRWRMEADRYAMQRERWAFSLSRAGRDALTGHLARGGGLLALHTAPICFDDWPGWRALVGGAWSWTRSLHPPLGPARVDVAEPTHPLVTGLAAFEVVDEVYSFLDLEPDVVPLLTSTVEGVAQPLLWARAAGGGRVVYDALGHDASSFALSEHRTILRRAALWAAGREPGEAA